jgi:hypothetical protein
MKGWRKIVVDSKEYHWRVASRDLVVRTIRGPTIVKKDLSLLWNMSWDAIEQAHWKGSHIPAIKPSHVAEYIKAVV